MPTTDELRIALNWLKQGAPVARGHANVSVETLIRLVQSVLDGER